MPALQSLREALGAPGLFTIGLLCLGVGYPAGLVAVGAFPAVASLPTYLAVGVLVGAALEVAYADTLDDALVKGRVGRLLPDHDRFDRVRSDGDDGDGIGGWSVLFTLLTGAITGGLQSVVPLAAPAVVGAVLGLVWTLAAVRLGRALSPVADGARPPPRGVSPSDNG